MLADSMPGRRLILLACAALAVAAAMAAAASGRAPQQNFGVEPVDAPACGNVVYGGPGPTADALIVSDLPLRGDSKARSKQMNDAIRLELKNAHWQAMGLRTAFQACDDSLASTGLWDKARCRANAKAYAKNQEVLAVVGTYNSGCAEQEIPILNKAPDGGLAMISPGNTFVCLTQKAKGCTSGEPNSLYPRGKRNYARVVPNDAYQGAGLASFAKTSGIKKPFVLYAQDDPTSLGQARNFRGAATKLGLNVAGFATWDPNATSYTALMNTVKTSGADGVVLAGLIEQNGEQVIKDKVAVLGDNSGKVKLLALDGFAQQSTITGAGSASAGMFASTPGRVPSSLTGKGKKLVSQLAQKAGGKNKVELFAPYAGQAVDVALQAIAKAGYSRRNIIKNVLSAKITKGVTGSFKILSTGDPSIGPITVSVAGKTFKPSKVINPPVSLVKAASQG